MNVLLRSSAFVSPLALSTNVPCAAPVLAGVSTSSSIATPPAPGSSLPLTFEENCAQKDKSVSFPSHSSAGVFVR